MKSPIFIVGLPRTGSTLWHNIFGRNINLCRIGEMHYLTPVKKDFRYFIKHTVGNLSDDDNVRKMFELIFSKEKFKGITEAFWEYDIGKIQGETLKEMMIAEVIKSDRSVESIFKIIIEQFVIYKERQRGCIKFPVYVNLIPRLVKWYPDCKIVHIIRDPRAIAVSRKNDPAGTAKKVRKYPYLSYFIRWIMVLYVSGQYMWSSRLHLSYRKKYANYKLFKYEDLLVNPEKTIHNLCEFTAVEFQEDMLNPGEGQASSITKEKKEGFDKSAAFRWMKHIKGSEKRIVTCLTRRSMSRFDYHPEKYLDLSDS
ncbi:MAG: sulfotransferase [Bacteroidota bacterium]